MMPPRKLLRCAICARKSTEFLIEAGSEINVGLADRKTGVRHLAVGHESGSSDSRHASMCRQVVLGLIAEAPRMPPCTALSEAIEKMHCRAPRMAGEGI
jgi:hypothetical protein